MVDLQQSFEGRGVPQNLDAERSVLGALLLHTDAIVDVTFLKPEDFYLPKHQQIFQALLAAYNTRTATDPIVVGEELSRQGKLEEVGGHEQLAACREPLCGRHRELFDKGRTGVQDW